MRAVWATWEGTGHKEPQALNRFFQSRKVCSARVSFLIFTIASRHTGRSSLDPLSGHVTLWGVPGPLPQKCIHHYAESTAPAPAWSISDACVFALGDGVSALGLLLPFSFVL